MRYRTLLGILIVALSVHTSVAWAGTKDVSPATARFEALKVLVGDWVQVGADGKTSEKVASSIRLTAAGTVLQETMFPGTDQEMVTMYHLDGANLVLTHYCAAGNQPRMRAEEGDKSNRIEFKFAGGTNFKPEGMHMDHATLIIVSKDRFQAEWVACKDGKACHTAMFDLIRKK